MKILYLSSKLHQFISYKLCLDIIFLPRTKPASLFAFILIVSLKQYPALSNNSCTSSLNCLDVVDNISAVSYLCPSPAYKYFKNPDIHPFNMQHEAWMFEKKWREPVVNMICECMEKEYAL